MVAEQKRRLKLLITEDDYENRKFLEIYLKKKFEIYVCDSEESFYERLTEEKFDVIIMDISLRGNKNGLELTKEIRNNPNYQKIPIVCYTAHAFPKDRINALKAGCDIYLSKPADIKVLLNSLFEAIEQREHPSDDNKISFYKN